MKQTRLNRNPEGHIRLSIPNNVASKLMTITALRASADIYELSIK